MAEASVRPNDVIEGVRDELECSICNEHFQKPKYLHCMHTFCEGCLQDLANSMKPKKSLPCPLCRHETPIPKQGISKGLKTNTMAASILERINSSAVNSGGGDNTKSLPKDTCYGHKDQVLNYFCRTCRRTVCRKCCIVDHCRPDHDVCKIQDVTGEKKAALKDIVAEVRSMLQECRLQNERTEEVKVKLQSSLEEARGNLNKRSEAMMARISARVEAASDAFEKVEQRRNTLIKKKEAELEIRKNCLMQLLGDAENLLYGSDATLVGNTAAVISQIKSSVRKMERKPDLDPSVGFVEFGTASASTAVANAQVGEVYEDTKWVMYARTGNNLDFSEARGVDIFEDGTIVIADNSGEMPGFVTIIDAVDVESCFLVDEQGRLLQSNKDFETFADVKSIEIDGCARDVIAVPVFHNDVTCSTCNGCPLIGSKFTCLECEDFHVCSECMSRNAHVGHPFTVTKYPFLYTPVVGMVSDECEFNLYRADHGGRCVSRMAFPNNNRPWADWLPQSNGPQTQLWSIAREPSMGQIFVSEAPQNVIYQYGLSRKNQGNALHMSLLTLFQINTEIKPWFIAVNRHRRQVAVSNWKACRVDIVDYWSQHQYSITTKGDGQRLRPNGVCYDGMDTLYIVHRDTKNNRGEVHRYNALDGTHVGVAITGLFRPFGIGIENGKMVVADCNEVKIFKRKVVAGKAKEDPEGVLFVSLPQFLDQPKMK